MTKKLEQKTQLALQSALSIANRILYDASCAGTPSAEKAKAARDHIERTLKSIAASHREAALRFETAHDYASARREIRLALMSTPSDAELSKEAGRILAEFKAAASKTPLPPPDKP